MARLCESEVRAKLSRQELCAEAIYQLLRLGKMDKETFTARMSALDRCGPDGAVGACYVTWMLLRNAPPSPERDAWMSQNTAKLRSILRYLEATSKEVDRDSSSGSSSTLRTIQPASASSCENPYWAHSEQSSGSSRGPCL